MNSVSVAIICKNASKTIEKTLQSVKWADEIIVIDDQSTDNTQEIVKKYTNKVFSISTKNFSQKRNEALKRVTGEWILYIDADEVVTTSLKQEIENAIQHNPKVYRLTRLNYFLGTPMYDDQVERLFPIKNLKSWVGDVHESPEFEGEVADLQEKLLHYTHQDIFSMLEKTNQWSEIEADLRIKANHPQVAWWRLMRIALTESWHQIVNKKILTFGRAGLFEGYFQVIDKLIVYVKLWEKQH